MCYYTVLREELDVKRTFARYALRSVCAVMLYSLLDEDHSSSLDAQEMFEVLREVFGEDVQGPELVALTDYLMTTVGRQQGTKVCFLSTSTSHDYALGLCIGDNRSCPNAA
jgi:hypothetical protein